MPPDSSCTCARSNRSSPTSPSIRCAVSRRSRSPRSGHSFKPNMTLPKTSSHGNSDGSWNTTCRSRPGPVTGLPSASTRPASGVVSPAMMSRNVDLPQPLGPTRHTTSPAATCIETSSSACTVARGVRNHFETPSTTSLQSRRPTGSGGPEDASLAIMAPPSDPRDRERSPGSRPAGLSQRRSAGSPARRRWSASSASMPARSAPAPSPS